jgi:hypothetical protein
MSHSEGPPTPAQLAPDKHGWKRHFPLERYWRPFWEVTITDPQTGATMHGMAAVKWLCRKSKETPDA